MKMKNKKQKETECKTHNRKDVSSKNKTKYRDQISDYKYVNRHENTHKNEMATHKNKDNVDQTQKTSNKKKYW